MTSADVPKRKTRKSLADERVYHQLPSDGRKMPMSVFESPSKSNGVRRTVWLLVPPSQKPLEIEKLPPVETFPASGSPTVDVTAKLPPEEPPPPEAMTDCLIAKSPPDCACAGMIDKSKISPVAILILISISFYIRLQISPLISGE